MPFPVPFLYPYDPTGTQAANKITAEHHVVTPPVNNAKANFIVPTASPFFGSTMVVRSGPLITDPLLVEGVDYNLVLQFMEATNVLYTPIYGGIVFNDHGFSQDVYLTYQTLGGPYVANDYTFVENFDQSLYHIRLVSWTQIVGLTSGFPPLPHPTPAPDLTGMAALVAKIEELVTAISTNAGGSGVNPAFFNHLITDSGAHEPSAVGLGNVSNFLTATYLDMVQRLGNRFVTPAVVGPYIDSLISALPAPAPRFDVRLELNYVDTNAFSIIVRAINGGLVTVGGKNHVWQTAAHTLPISLLDRSTLLSVFLHRTGPNTVEVTHARIDDNTMFPRRNASGIVVAYNKLTGVYDDSYTFIGHVYWNYATGFGSYYDPISYRNMGYGYARSYHNDVGTLCCGFYAGLGQYTEARPFSREGRPCNTARLMGADIHFSTNYSEMEHFGIGALDGSVPHDNSTPSQIIPFPTIAPSTMLTMGYIVWPYEILKIRAQALLEVGTDSSVIGVRTFAGPPSTGTLERATVIDISRVGSHNLNGNVGTAFVSLETEHYTDAVHHDILGYPWPVLGGFRLFELITTSSTLYGSTGLPGGTPEVGSTRITVQPTTYSRSDTLITHNPATIDIDWGEYMGTPYY